MSEAVLATALRCPRGGEPLSLSLLAHTGQWQQPAAGTQCSSHFSPRLGPRAPCRGDDLISMTTCNLTFFAKRAELAPGSGCRVLRSVQQRSVQLCCVLVTFFTAATPGLAGAGELLPAQTWQEASCALAVRRHTRPPACLHQGSRVVLTQCSTDSLSSPGHLTPAGGWPGLGKGLRDNLQARKIKETNQSNKIMYTKHSPVVFTDTDMAI